MDNSRYIRQIALSEIGEEGQKKIAEAKVCIIGCGALGSMIAMQLAGAGVGCIGIADFDTIEISNLQRQFFFKTEEAGKNKAEVLSKSIMALNPDVQVLAYKEIINFKKAEKLYPDFQIIVDATDNPASKIMTDTVCQKLGLPCVIGGVEGFRGQILTINPGDTRYKELFPKVTEGDFLPCSLAGVAGPAAATCASIQAMETLKLIMGKGETLSGKLLTFNLENNTFKSFSLSPE